MVKCHVEMKEETFCIVNVKQRTFRVVEAMYG